MYRKLIVTRIYEGRKREPTWSVVVEKGITTSGSSPFLDARNISLSSSMSATFAIIESLIDPSSEDIGATAGGGRGGGAT